MKKSTRFLTLSHLTVLALRALLFVSTLAGGMAHAPSKPVKNEHQTGQAAPIGSTAAKIAPDIGERMRQAKTGREPESARC